MVKVKLPALDLCRDGVCRRDVHGVRPGATNPISPFALGLVQRGVGRRDQGIEAFERTRGVAGSGRRDADADGHDPFVDIAFVREPLLPHAFA